jgi:hypothetical protein
LGHVARHSAFPTSIDNLDWWITKKSKEVRRQGQAFIEAARQLGCDEDEAHFGEKLKKIARHKPQEATRKKPDSK